MKQITEDYCSFEIAKLLKEKGFNWQCPAYYSEYFDNWNILRFWKCGKPKTYDTVRNSGYLLVPTQSMAMRWLREVYNTHISVEMGFDVDNSQHFFYMPSICKFSNKTGEYNIPFGEEEFDTYEQACEAAIKYCLENLI